MKNWIVEGVASVVNNFTQEPHDNPIRPSDSQINSSRITYAETLADTIESDPICITDLFQNKTLAYFFLVYN